MAEECYQPPAEYESFSNSASNYVNLRCIVRDILEKYWSGDYSLFIMQNDRDNMKSTHHFRDQVSVISGWFDQWNDCEQTVALYSLIKRLGPTQAHFLALVLDQNLSQCMELSMQQQEANDPTYISSLSSESKETAVTQLLSHLPLLRPGNEDAKTQYLGLIPKILAHSIGNSVHIEESRQLLSYSLIHPAISNEDRRSLTMWLRQLEESIHNYSYPVTPPVAAIGGNGIPSTTTNGPVQHTPVIDGYGGHQYGSLGHRMDTWRPGPLMGLNGNHTVDVNGYSVLNGLGSNSLPPGVGSHHMTLHAINSAPPGGISLSSHPDGTHTLPLTHSRIRRSNSLTPPGNTPTHCSRPPSTQSNWSIEHDGIVTNCNSTSQRTEHAPLSPQSSVTSSGSGSESQKDDRDIFNVEGSGMKDVPMWLKGLRLHKYSYIFKTMSYEQMMNVTEEKLEQLNITKGARHKIVLSIHKLKERQSALKNIEKDIQDGVGTIRAALNELKSMIQTPIKSYSSSMSCIDSNCQESNACSVSDSSNSDPPSAPPSPTGSENDASAQVADGDLPGQITRLMGKLCSSLLISPRPEDENLNLFMMLIDKCLSHEAFTPQQKRRLFSWKQQIQKVWHPLPPRRSLDNRQNRGKWNNFNHNGTSQNTEFNTPVGGSVTLRRRIPVQFQQPPQRMPISRQGIIGNYTSAQASQRSPLSTVLKRPSLQDHMKPHVQVQRTHSAPVRPNPLSVSVFGKSLDASTDSANDPEINNRLESLCLSVTEHALGGFDAVPLY